MKLEHKSFDGNPGKNIGDDTCQKVIDLGIKRLPPNKRFRKGIPVRKYLLMGSQSHLLRLNSLIS